MKIHIQILNFLNIKAYTESLANSLTEMGRLSKSERGEIFCSMLTEEATTGDCALASTRLTPAELWIMQAHSTALDYIYHRFKHLSIFLCLVRNEEQNICCSIKDFFFFPLDTISV